MTAAAAADPGADLRFRRLMLGLRRFLTGPRDGPRLRGLVRRDAGLTRAFLELASPHQTVFAVDLDGADALAPVLTVLREVATKPYLPRILPPAPPDEFATLAVNASAYLSWIGHRAVLTEDDLVDAVLSESVGDCAWRPGEPLDGDAVRGVVGYIRTAPGRLRLYVARGDTTIGLDLPLADPAEHPGPARAWLAGYDRDPTGALPRGDSYCDHLVDLTGG